jgi:hypothetical protein
MTDTTTTDDRYARIASAYEAALADRAADDRAKGCDPTTVSALDFLPAIFDAVPDAEIDEIEAALNWLGDRNMKKADALRRYKSERREGLKQK